MIGSFIKNGLQ